MKTRTKLMLLSTLIGVSSLAVFAQTPPSPNEASGKPHHMEHMGRMDPATMEKMMAKRAEDLKAKLKLTAQQEPAWNTFIQAMKPAIHKSENRPSQQEMDKLTTPERLDKMRTLRTQHLTEMSDAMNKRDDAIKTFYSTLSVEQKKTFDVEHASMEQHHKHDGR